MSNKININQSIFLIKVVNRRLSKNAKLTMSKIVNKFFDTSLFSFRETLNVAIKRDSSTHLMYFSSKSLSPCVGQVIEKFVTKGFHINVSII